MGLAEWMNLGAFERLVEARGGKEAWAQVFPGIMRGSEEGWEGQQKDLFANADRVQDDLLCETLVEKLQEEVMFRPVWICQYITEHGEALFKEYVILFVAYTTRNTVALQLYPKKPEQDEAIMIDLWVAKDKEQIYDYWEGVHWSFRTDSSRRFMCPLQPFNSREPFRYLPGLALWSLPDEEQQGVRLILDISTHPTIIRRSVLQQRFGLPGGLQFVDANAVRSTAMRAEEKAPSIEIPASVWGTSEGMVWIDDDDKDALQPTDKGILNRLVRTILSNKSDQAEKVEQGELHEQELKSFFDQYGHGYYGDFEHDAMAKEMHIRPGQLKNAWDALKSLYRAEIAAFNQAYTCSYGERLTEADHALLVRQRPAILCKRDFENYFNAEAILMEHRMDQKEHKELEKLFKKFYFSDKKQEQDGEEANVFFDHIPMVQDMSKIHTKYNIFGGMSVNMAKTYVAALYQYWKEHNQAIGLSEEEELRAADQHFKLLVGQVQNKILWGMKEPSRRLQLWKAYLTQYAGVRQKPWRCQYPFISIRLFLALHADVSKPLETNVAWLDAAYEKAKRKMDEEDSTLEILSEFVVERRRRKEDLHQQMHSALAKLNLAKDKEAVTWQPYWRLLTLLPKEDDIFQIVQRMVTKEVKVIVKEAGEEDEDEYSKEHVQRVLRDEDFFANNWQKQMLQLSQRFDGKGATKEARSSVSTAPSGTGRRGRGA